MHEPLPGRAKKRAEVDAAVLIEAPVLVGDEHRDIARIDVVGRRRQPPTPVRQSERTQQAPVAVDHDRRALARGGEVERAERCSVAGPGEVGGEGGDENQREHGSEREGEPTCVLQAGRCGGKAFRAISVLLPPCGGGWEWGRANVF